jgi:hypothetical protein
MKVRELAAYSSFSIPDVPPDRRGPWLDCGPEFYSATTRKVMRAQRQLLEEKAVRDGYGCDLLLHPFFKSRKMPSRFRCARLRILVRFLEKVRSDPRIRVVIWPERAKENLLIFGDWFTASSLTPDPRFGFIRTELCWHAPHVLRKMREFDDLFEDLWAHTSGSHKEKMDSVIARLQDEIRRLARRG